MNSRERNASRAQRYVRRPYATMLLPVALALACGVVAACAASDLPPESHVINQHVIKVGDVITPTRLRCHAGADRIVANPSEIQLITFSTPNDCSACVPHLAGLEEVLKRAPVHIDNFYVSWAPPAETTSAIASYRAFSNRAVCFDEAGALWDTYNISHTPITVVLRRGQIVYMHDMPLTKPEPQEIFLADLHKLGAY
jgi:hypothetical protein